MAWFPKRRVVVPVDFSDESLHALDTALGFVTDASELHVVHVLPQLSPMEPGVLWGDVNEESRRRHVAEEVQKRLGGVPNYCGVKIEVRVGVTYKQICAYADEVDAELIVIPSHGRTGAAHLLLGSTAERVVQHAHCPVLVLKKNRKA